MTVSQGGLYRDAGRQREDAAGVAKNCGKMEKKEPSDYTGAPPVLRPFLPVLSPIVLSPRCTLFRVLGKLNFTRTETLALEPALDLPA